MEIALTVIATVAVTAAVTYLLARMWYSRVQRDEAAKYEDGISLARKESADLYNKLRRDLDKANKQWAELIGTTLDEVSDTVGSVEEDIQRVVEDVRTLAVAHNALAEMADEMQNDVESVRQEVAELEIVEEEPYEVPEPKYNHVEEVEVDVPAPPAPSTQQPISDAPRRVRTQEDLVERGKAAEAKIKKDELEGDVPAEEDMPVAEEGKMITDLRPTAFREAPPEKSVDNPYGLNTAVAGVEEHKPGNPRNRNPFSRPGFH